ncbi:MAG: prolyl oligopeptidase family serine peptidase, partial [Pseudobutyrivibrio sp.]|nr:prolyl oligopeptidase family serine peptidase [Pseudobutyrivibrio sp.]
VGSKEINNRPDAVILSYPVISMGEYAHENSRTALCGKDATTEELDYMSLENQVKENTPPVCIWHCKTDASVPVENSNLFYNACKEKNVPVNLKLFDHGKHGMSLATEEWANAPLYGTYTLEQFFEALRYLNENNMELPDPIKGKMIPEGADIVDFYIAAKNEARIHEHGDEEIASWVDVAFEWLNDLFLE